MRVIPHQKSILGKSILGKSILGKSPTKNRDVSDSDPRSVAQILDQVTEICLTWRIRAAYGGLWRLRDNRDMPEI